MCAFKKMEEGRESKVVIPNQPIAEVSIPDFLYLCLTELSLAHCAYGVDDGLVMECSEYLQEFYFTHVYVSCGDIQLIYRDTIHQNNYRWRKERQVRLCDSIPHV